MADKASPNHNQSLTDACETATELVSYLSSTGNLPEDVANAEFFEILDKARRNDLAVGEEQAFWNGYSKLAHHAKPTQIDALRFRSYLQGRRQVDSAVEREYQTNLSAIRKIRVYSIISFVFTLLLLTYVSLTGSYMSSNKTLAHENRQIESRIYAGTRLEGLLERIEQSPITSGTVGGSEGGSEGGGEGSQTVAGQQTSNPLFELQRTEALAQIVSHQEYNLRALQFFQLYTATGTGTEETDGSGTTPFAEGLSQRTKIEAHQNLINLLISSYFLPVFTSLLGVTVFILRRTSSSLNSGQYRLYESGTYSYRMTLGIVGGIVISWFSTTDGSGVVSSLTPAALAFVVGYSIEVLYNLLDSIVKALGAEDKGVA